MPVTWPEGGGHIGGPYLVPRGGEPFSYRPLENVLLVNEYAQIVHSAGASDKTRPSVILKLANKYGLLYGRADKLSAEPLSAWNHADMALTILLGKWADGDGAAVPFVFNETEVAQNTPRMDWEEGRERPVLLFEPKNLNDALKLQVAELYSGGAEARRCEYCSRPFVYGAGTPRRVGGEYCSPSCRRGAWRKRQGVA